MDWQKLLTDVIISVVGLLLSGLGTWLTVLISKKIKNETVKEILNGALNIVKDGVDHTYQTYVEALKGTSFWDEKAMKEAQNRAVDYIKSNLSASAIEYIKETGKTVEEWIREQIEIAIKKSKDSAEKQGYKLWLEKRKSESIIKLLFARKI